MSYPYGKKHLLVLLLALAIAGLPSSVSAQELESEDEYDLEAHYKKTHHMIPMRDGVELYTIVYTPRDTTREYPILLMRTPYSIAPYGPDEYPDQLGPSPQFARSGYTFVFQDVRGKYRSEGDFQVIEPLWTKLNPPRDSVDESTDAWDTIEWLVNNLDHHNGRVGMWGISYPAWETVMGMVDAHPALKAASPQASPSDMWIGDDWHHHGAFRLMYAFYWLAYNASTVETGEGGEAEPFEYPTPWGYELFLEGGSTARVAERYFEETPPAWKGFIEHPNYDQYWKRKNVLRYLDDVGDLPILNVAGWFDAEDFYGPMSIYRTIEEEDPENQSTLAVGPWRHGGWYGKGAHLGCIVFDSPTATHYQREIVYPFFQKHLKGKGEWQAPEAAVFETGDNQWHRFEQWPPAQTETKRLYLRAGNADSFEKPPAEGSDRAGDSYVSDPANPVPFTDEIRTTQGHLWMVGDQRSAATRPDVQVYTSEVLTEDVTVAGDITAHLNVSTTGTDADWVVKVIDVYPPDAPDNEYCEKPMGSYQMLVAGEIMPGRFRNSYTDPQPMTSDKVTEIEFSLRNKFHTFKKGHRIMIQIQSTWFPVYARNPQTYVPNIYRADPSDYRKQTHTIYRSDKYPSYIALPILPQSAQPDP